MESQLWASRKFSWKWLYWLQPWKMDKVWTCNRVENCTSGELKGINSKMVHREVWDVIGIKCRMKDWSKGIHNRNEGQGYMMEYFEWKSKEIGFYPKDGGGHLVCDLTGHNEKGNGNIRHWRHSPPPSLTFPLPTGAYCNSSGMIAEVCRC